MSSPAIRWIATRGTKGPAASIQLLCRIKSGVSAGTEGVRTVSDNAVEVRVAARARNGEANKALIQVIAEVSTVRRFIYCVGEVQPSLGSQGAQDGRRGGKRNEE